MNKTINRAVALFILVILMLAVAGCVMLSPPYIVFPNIGLLAHYEFDGTCQDSSSNANHGETVGDFAYTEGAKGSAIVFDGIDNPGHVRVQNSSSLSLSGAMTISAHLRLDGSYGQTSWNASGAKIDNAPQCVFAKRGDRSGFYLNVAYESDGRLFVIFGMDDYRDSASSVSTRTNYTLGEWVHIAVVYEAQVLKLYIDGKKEAEAEAPNASFDIANNEDLLVGIQRNPEAGLEYWYPLHGAVDELWIYTKALSWKEIRALSTP